MFEEVYKRVSEMNLENPSEITLEIFREVVKDLRRESRSQSRKEKANVNEDLATKRQREALHKFGLKQIPRDLSKKEASEILNELIGYSKENDKEAIVSLVQELNQKWNMSQ
jgi:hypothetical protein